ncbi:unnamed protein product [Paramecium primaurelia]|uniref:Uncharacterized protein n=1 Tax=Paramecium primaurelia TaxID=5886 RepID=A0A8S1K495_PARPR|nr:unnamed protein product [Paramecium primaurelia]
MSMSQQRYQTLMGSDDISQICSGFIRFIEEILLPIAKQDTKQFQNWTKFKEIIDPFNKKIELQRVEQYFQQFNNSKINQENKPPSPILKEQTKNTVNIQDRSYSIPQTTIIQTIKEDYENKLKEITDKINKTFHQNNTHLDILLKMNNTTQDAKNKLELNNNNQRNTSITRRVDFKRRNTDYYSFKPINNIQ